MTNRLPTLEQVIRATRTTRNQVDSWRRLGLLTEPLERIEGRKGINVPYRAALEIGLLAAVMAFKVPPSKAGLLKKVWIGTIETAEEGAAHAIDVRFLQHPDDDIASFTLDAETPLWQVAQLLTGRSTPSAPSAEQNAFSPDLADMPPSICLISPAAIRHQIAALYSGVRS